MILWNIAAKSTLGLVGMVWTNTKEINWNRLNIYSDKSEKKIIMVGRRVVLLIFSAKHVLPWLAALGSEMSFLVCN